MNKDPIRARHGSVWTALVIAAVAASALVAVPAGAATQRSAPAASRPADSGSYAVIGQPTLADASLGSRCASDKARFSTHDFGGFATYGPTGIAIGPAGRLFVVDDGGHRVLSWPNADAMSSCQVADQVIGGGGGVMAGPEAITVDGAGNVYVADTLGHTIDIFNRNSSGGYPAQPTYVLGTPGNPGTATNAFNFPRGLAVDENGRLFVADDYNKRVLIFNPPFSTGMSAADSIGAASDGGFSSPKAVAVSGDSLFVADYDGNRVLRFTGPFDNPATTYASTATFTGIEEPVDLAVGADGSLYVTTQRDDGAAVVPGVAFYPDAVAGAGSGSPAGVTSFNGAITGEPLGVAVDASSRLFLSDYRGYRVLVRHSPTATGPVDRAATSAAGSLLQLLRSRAGVSKGRVLLGQEIPTFARGKSHWYRDFSRLHKRTLRTPIVMGGEVDSLRNDANDPVISAMIAHARAGGVLEMDWHPNDPVDNSYPGSPVTASQMSQMSSNAGSPLYTAWHAEMDAAAAVLQKYAAAGVPVLFRPLVEMNGVNFFWWADDGSTGATHAARIQAFAALWREMGQYLTVTKGLHNLLFLWSPNAIGCQCAVPAMTYYPGSAYVDVTGIDIYDNALSIGRSPVDSRGRNTYDAMVATGKPFGIAEFGQGPNASGNGTGAAATGWDARTLTKRVRDSYPATAFATAWYSSFDSNGKIRWVYGLSDVAHVAALLKDKLIRTLPASAP